MLNSIKPMIEPMVQVLVIVWWGSAAVLIVYLPIVWVRTRKLARRLRLGQCPECGYSLTGNKSGACPECGKPT